MHINSERAKQQQSSSNECAMVCVKKRIHTHTHTPKRCLEGAYSNRICPVSSNEDADATVDPAVCVPFRTGWISLGKFCLGGVGEVVVVVVVVVVLP